ncbi:hypothetical protein CHELA41_24016 [Hyphomicrobiales bacterium]|nr:hypothetical protein CHELA41_24016 [Hyphomicrobiales bacterium]
MQPESSMRERPSARVLLLDQSGCVLLFKFVHRSGPLAGRIYWATPGGRGGGGRDLRGSGAA